MNGGKEISVRVRYQETDQMKVVHHGNYFTWFEVGRTNLIRELGTSYSDLEQRGILLPVLEAHCEYKAPARYDDEVVIATKIGSLSPVKITFSYEVYRPLDGKILAVGHTTHAFVDENMIPHNIRKRAPEVYDLLYGFFMVKNEVV